MPAGPPRASPIGIVQSLGVGGKASHEHRPLIAARMADEVKRFARSYSPARQDQRLNCLFKFQPAMVVQTYGGANMHLIQTISTKTLAQTTAGELIKLRVPGGNHFAIVLDNETQGRLVGFLEPTGAASYPIFRRVSSSLNGLSYGHEWIVDLVSNDESWAGNRNHLTTAGALLVDAASLWLSLQPSSDDHRSTESYFDLRNNKFTGRHPENFTPFLSWRIWQSKEEFLRPGAKPLIEVSAVSGR